MPLRSMTGYGQYQSECDGLSQMWEVRSVNSRYLDPKWRLPMQARHLEPRLDKTLRKEAARGRVEISLNLRFAEGLEQVSFNFAQASAMLLAVSRFAEVSGTAFTPDYNQLFGLPQLWDGGYGQDGRDGDVNKQYADFDENLLQGLQNALADWNQSRIREGEQLGLELAAHFAQMRQWVTRIMDRAPGIKQERFEQVRFRLDEMLVSLGSELDQGRFLQEMVIMADRLDVSEELSRLAAHLDRLDELLNTQADAGRKLDFTLQECFREINTCGNKIQDTQISRLVVDFKNELEKCREQVQNLE